MTGFGAIGAIGVLTGCAVLMIDAAPAGAATTACDGGAITVTDEGAQGGDSHGWDVVGFTNHSGRSCTLTGYPGADVVDGSGQVLGSAQRTLQGYGGGATSVQTITVDPGGTASATVEWLSFDPATGGDCPGTGTLAVTPPGTATTTRLSVKATTCALQVHPVVAGTSGHQTPNGVPAGSGGLLPSGGHDRLATELLVGSGVVLVAAGALVARRRVRR